MPRPKKNQEPAAEIKKPARRGRPSKKVQESKKSSRFDFKKYYESIKTRVSTHRKRYVIYLVVILAIVLLSALVFWKKNWFVVAMVNRQPITSVELYQQLKAKYGKDMLDEMIRDRLISQEAERKNIQISESDVNAKVKNTEDMYGGHDALLQLLDSNGITEKDFRNQVKIKLMVDKLLGDAIKVTDKDIDDYIAQNPQDTDVLGSDDKKGPNRDAIREKVESTKFNAAYPTWYSDLEKRSNILKFI